MISIVSILIGVGLHYVPGSSRKIVFIISELISGGIL